MNKQELIDRLRAKAKENGQKAARWLDYTDKNYFIGIQCGYDRSAKLVDQLDEPVHEKVSMRQEVGEELDDYKKNSDFNRYLKDIVIQNDYMYALTFIAQGHSFTELADAWRYGWKAEKEPVSLVYVPGTNKKFLYNKRGDSSTRAAKLETPIVPSPVTSYQTAYGQYKPLYWFTDAEITKFCLQDCEKEEVTDDGMGC